MSLNTVSKNLEMLQGRISNLPISKDIMFIEGESGNHAFTYIRGDLSCMSKTISKAMMKDPRIAIMIQRAVRQYESKKESINGKSVISN